jgi:hypothetical protein
MTYPPTTITLRVNDAISDARRVIDEPHAVIQVERLAGQHELAAQRAGRADGGGQQDGAGHPVGVAVASLLPRHRASVAAVGGAAWAAAWLPALDARPHHGCRVVVVRGR